MNTNYTQDDNSLGENENNTSNNNAYIQNKKIKTSDILFGLLCVLIAFVFWCYANYIEDPIIQKEVTVDFVLVNGKVMQDIAPDKVNIVIYGEKSVLGSITNNTITIHVDISEFDDKTEINYKIDYPKGIHSHTTHKTLTLNYPNE